MLRALLVFFGLISFAVYGQNSWSNCEAFKTGTFYLVNGTDTCYIRRSDNRQFESCQSDPDTEYQLIVIWLSDCKYILRDIHYNPYTTPKVMRKDVVMKITETYEDRYLVLAKTQGKGKQWLTIYRNKTVHEDENTQEK